MQATVEIVTLNVNDIVTTSDTYTPPKDQTDEL